MSENDLNEYHEKVYKFSLDLSDFIAKQTISTNDIIGILEAKKFLMLANAKEYANKNHLELINLNKNHLELINLLKNFNSNF